MYLRTRKKAADEERPAKNMKGKKIESNPKVQRISRKRKATERKDTDIKTEGEQLEIPISKDHNSKFNPNVPNIEYSFKKPKLNSTYSKLDKHATLNTSIFLEDLTVLKKLVRLQHDTYYKNLDCPKFLGKTNYEILRLPSDINIFGNIVKQAESTMEKIRLHEQIKDENGATSEYSYKDEPLLDITRIDNLNLADVARIHNLDISSIKGSIMSTNYTDKFNIKTIGKTLDKQLVKLKDQKLLWPVKAKKKTPKKTTTDQTMSQISDDSQFKGIPWLS